MSSDPSICQICGYAYGDRVVPCLTKCCGQDVCFQCLEKYRREEIAKLTGNRKNVPCMLCKTPFHSEREDPWVKNDHCARLLGIEVDDSEVQEHKMVMRFASSGSKKSRSTRLDGRGSREAVGTSDANNRSMDPSADAAVSTEQSSATVVTLARRSQRVNRREGETNYDSDVSIEDTGIIDQRPTNLSAAVAPHELAEDSVAEATGTDGSMIEFSVADGEDESYAQESSSSQKRRRTEDFGEDAKEWSSIVMRRGIRIFRVRILSIESAGVSDPFGRRCSQWCVKNGFIAATARMMVTLPDHVRNNGKACRDHIRGLTHKELLKGCNECTEYKSLNIYAHTFRSFVDMKPGDVVVMAVRGKAPTPLPALVFGVVENDDLILLKKDEARRHGFPWDFRQDGEVDKNYNNGIMLRNVKWYRHGILQDVRGTKSANWLGEFQPKWLVEIGVKSESTLVEAIEKMTSVDFFGKTKAIDDNWSSHGLIGVREANTNHGSTNLSVIINGERCSGESALERCSGESALELTEGGDVGVTRSGACSRNNSMDSDDDLSRFSQDEEDSGHGDDGEGYMLTPKCPQLESVDEDCKQWCDIILKTGIRIFRLRTFSTESANSQSDPLGRRCSQWCVKHGFVACSSRILVTLPENVRNNGDVSRDYIREFDHKELLKGCRSCIEYDSLETYAHTYRSFIEMKPGDVVVMAVRGKTSSKGPPPTLVFGVVESDDLILLKKQEAMDNHSFPWDFKQDGKVNQNFNNGIMLRKVKWHRYGKLHDVRGKKAVNWLGEFQPIWLTEIGTKNASTFVEAIEKMSSMEFFANTKVIDCDWSNRGLYQ
ncbi:hypothetical protein ACHAWF_006088 [Thalassiosira exigua]